MRHFVVGILAVLLAASGSGRHIVAGVDFDEIDIGGGHHLHHGTYTQSDPGITTTLQALFSGTVSAKTVAVALLHSELPATGYNESARAYLVSGGRAGALTDLGTFSFFTDGGPYPERWFYATFTDGKLYTDVWDAQARCQGKRDWVSSTYTLSGNNLVRVYQLRHHRASVPVACSEAPHSTPSTSTTLYNLAIGYQDKGQYAQAIAAWTNYLQSSPEDSDALNLRARDYLENGEFAKAIADYDRSEKLGSKDDFLYWGRARAHIYTNRPDLAVTDLTSAISNATPGQSPVYASAVYAERGQLYFALRRFSDAANDFASALKQNGADATIVLMAHFAAARGGVDDSTAFRSRLTDFNFAKWPGVLMQFVENRATRLQVLAAAARANDRCFADFVLAENALLDKQVSQARSDFSSAEQQCDRYAFERYTAAAELEHLQ